MEKVVKDVFDEDELKARRANAPDVKESFESGREDDVAMPNIWLPDGVLPGFKEACLDFFLVRYPFYQFLPQYNPNAADTWRRHAERSSLRC